MYKFKIGDSARLVDSQSDMSALGLPACYAGNTVQIVGYSEAFGFYRVKHPSVSLPLAVSSEQLEVLA